MRFAGISDLHFDDKLPESRTDEDYLGTALDKFAFVCDHCISNGIKVLLVGGDFFNTPRITFHHVSRIAKLLFKFKEQGLIIHVVPGQHDLYFHNRKNKNLPIRLFHSAGLIKYYNESARIQLKNNVYLYTCPWEVEVPKPKSKKETSILLIHTMVIGDAKLWEKQTEYTKAKDLLKQFTFVVSGDNHHFVLYERKGHGQILFNSGSMLRRKTDQKKHKPCFGVMDTKTRECEVVYIPVKPIKEVMDFSKKENKTEIEINLDPFLKKLESGTDDLGLDYPKNVKKDLSLLDKRAKNMAIKIMSQCEEEQK